MSKSTFLRQVTLLPAFNSKKVLDAKYNTRSQRFLPGVLLADASSRADVSRGLLIGEESLGHTGPVLVDSSRATFGVSISLADEGLEDEDLLGDLLVSGQVGTELGNSGLAGLTVNLNKNISTSHCCNWT